MTAASSADPARLQTIGRHLASTEIVAEGGGGDADVVGGREWTGR